MPCQAGPPQYFPGGTPWVSHCLPYLLPTDLGRYVWQACSVLVVTYLDVPFCPAPPARSLSHPSTTDISRFSLDVRPPPPTLANITLLLLRVRTVSGYLKRALVLPESLALPETFLYRPGPLQLSPSPSSSQSKTDRYSPLIVYQLELFAAVSNIYHAYLVHPLGGPRPGKPLCSPVPLRWSCQRRPQGSG